MALNLRAGERNNTLYLAQGCKTTFLPFKEGTVKKKSETPYGLKVKKKKPKTPKTTNRESGTF